MTFKSALLFICYFNVAAKHKFSYMVCYIKVWNIVLYLKNPLVSDESCYADKGIDV